MSFGGNLSSVPLSDVFQLILSGKKTGALRVRGNDRLYRIFFKNGNIVRAAHPRSEEVTSDVGKAGQPVGTAAGRAGTIALSVADRRAEGLGKTRAEQVKGEVREAICRILELTSGDFVFEEGAVPKGSASMIELNPLTTLVESARRLEEWRQIRQELPDEKEILSFTAVMGHGSEDVRLNRRDLGVLAAIDGQSSFAEVARRSGLDAFEFARSYHKLSKLSLVQHHWPLPGSPFTPESPAKAVAFICFFHRLVQEECADVLSRYLGRAAARKLESAVETTRRIFPFVDSWLDAQTGSVDFDRLETLSQAMPETARITKLSFACFRLSAEYVSRVFLLLGERVASGVLSRIRKASLERREADKALLTAYGLDDGVNAILRYDQFAGDGKTRKGYLW